MKKSLILGLTLGILFSCSNDLDETETVANEALVTETETINSGILDDPAFKSFELDGEVITDPRLIEESYANSHYVEQNYAYNKVVMYSTQEEFNEYLKVNPEIARRIQEAKTSTDAGISSYSGSAIANGEVPSLAKEQNFPVDANSRTLSNSQIDAITNLDTFHTDLHYAYAIANSSTSGRTYTFDLYSNPDLTTGGIGANKITASNTSTTVGTTTMNMNIGFGYIFNNSFATIHLSNDSNSLYYVYAVENANYTGSYKVVVVGSRQHVELTRSNFGPNNASPKSIFAWQL
ncbi:hypothetical protein ACFO3O_05855 [Dokdonia ponticola]|uniref:Lipoprotein n=1 Tax=Dokdonia ponticola TaxID=2041041 RepID=A0ABV9HUP0_9FLAO